MHIILETFCNPLCFVSAARKGSNKFLFLILLSMPWLAVSKGHAQFTFATDNASSSAYSDGWASGDNGGSGFNAWSISIPGPNAGVFIGNPSNNGMGTTGIGTTAFGLFSSANNSGYANASRDFATSLQVGDSLSFHWAMNWDSSGGARDGNASSVRDGPSAAGPQTSRGARHGGGIDRTEAQSRGSRGGGGPGDQPKNPASMCGDAEAEGGGGSEIRVLPKVADPRGGEANLGKGKGAGLG